jgi:squalene-hopene/tetraprenyl-beta-curcumene cyclase
VLNDAQSTGKLSDPARQALDLMWTVQRPDGGWKWPDCNYAPMEIDDHYGATLAALSVGLAPGGYAETPAARAGLEKLRSFFRSNPPKSLHHRAMLAWCSVRIEGIATPEERQKTLFEVLALQLADGGWSTASFLTDWRDLKLQEDRPLDTKTSDGYGTGFVILLARELGVPAEDPRLQRGLAWLLSHQRESGRWFTRSPVVYARNLISNAGSAFDILALQACGKFPGGTFGKPGAAASK